MHSKHIIVLLLSSSIYQPLLASNTFLRQTFKRPHQKPMTKSRTQQQLGQVFANKKALNAYKRNHLNSFLKENNQRIRVIFINQTETPLTLCWVHENGKLYHYYKLQPCSTTLTGMLNDGIQINHNGTHLENTFLGHAFVLGSGPSSEKERNEADDDNNGDIGKIVAGYRPMRVRVSSSNEDVESEGPCVHLVTITQKPHHFHRIGLKKDKYNYEVKVTQCDVDSAPLDTSKKVYHDMVIGGWNCKCEEGLFEACKNDENSETENEDSVLSKVRQRLEDDLLAASKKLPTRACKQLKESTPIWINKSQRYGPKCAPIRGTGMCFHPDSDWLVENGMSSEKKGGVELYEARKYLDDCDLWYGAGGVMIHELSHAWHNKFTKDGYDNEEIIECYKNAMKEKLYDCVKVHNSTGGTDECKAYAATDPMEYFAELSVAFLGGVGDDKDLEYNKWFPFNCQQLKEHDPRAYKLLLKIWGFCEEP